MVPSGHTDGWTLFFLAAFVQCVHLQRNNSSLLDADPLSENQTYRPVLQPTEVAPTTGSYVIIGRDGTPCIKATVGAEFIVTEEKKTWFFNLNPSRVMVSGYCGNDEALLSLTLPGNASGLHFTFRKEKESVYVADLTAYLSPQPACKGCFNKTYLGSVTQKKLFEAASGQSFKCTTEQSIRLGSQLSIKLGHLQMQAFSLQDGQYGIALECWPDFDRRIIPHIIRAVLIGLLLITVLSLLLIRERRRSGYERL
ncbi:lysosome-associated membrane glycoprotein 3 [Cololabis saira]|uniref:lysosome-associated membrane glycoprotein 3 n=1 Tax=Cololabis saira TaxID=129043 RepID=UPI002AD27331|nr:lysosome-associated membrane glycoprotein 3 [Cololabis saira]